jgi:hypothetical protein
MNNAKYTTNAEYMESLIKRALRSPGESCAFGTSTFFVYQNKPIVGCVDIIVSLKEFACLEKKNLLEIIDLHIQYVYNASYEYTDKYVNTEYADPDDVYVTWSLKNADSAELLNITYTSLSVDDYINKYVGITCFAIAMNNETVKIYHNDSLRKMNIHSLQPRYLRTKYYKSNIAPEIISETHRYISKIPLPDGTFWVAPNYIVAKESLVI